MDGRIIRRNHISALASDYVPGLGNCSDRPPDRRSALPCGGSGGILFVDPVLRCGFAHLNKVCHRRARERLTLSSRPLSVLLRKLSAELKLLKRLILA